MENFSIKTPKELGLTREQIFEKCLLFLKIQIESNQFRFKTPEEFDEVSTRELNDVLINFNWKLNSRWKGNIEDGYTMWKIIPMEKDYN